MRVTKGQGLTIKYPCRKKLSDTNNKYQQVQIRAEVNYKSLNIKRGAIMWTMGHGSYASCEVMKINYVSLEI